MPPSGRPPRSERVNRITNALAGVYEDTMEPEAIIMPHHVDAANALMDAVELGDAAKLHTLFAVVDQPEDVLAEIATELIVSAAQLGQVEAIRALERHGADLEEPDLRRGGRPLMHAAYNGHTAAAKALVELGAELDARDDSGYTALMVAVFADRSSAVDVLLEAGAEVGGAALA
jgi:ankyrin repeat protein